MEFLSDRGEINSLLKTDEMTNVEFSENVPTYSNNSSKRDWDYGVDTVESDSKFQKGGETSKTLDSYEKDFFAIFDKAREYRKRIMDVQNRMEGGAEESSSSSGEKKEKVVNSTLRLMLDMTKMMKDSKKFPDIQQKHFMKISKIIVTEAKKRANVEVINDKVKEIALSLSKNPEKFIAQFKEEQKNEATSSSQNNSATSSVSSSNNRNSRNDWRDWRDGIMTDQQNKYTGDSQDYVNRSSRYAGIY